MTAADDRDAAERLADRAGPVFSDEAGDECDSRADEPRVGDDVCAGDGEAAAVLSEASGAAEATAPEAISKPAPSTTAAAVAHATRFAVTPAPTRAQVSFD